MVISKEMSLANLQTAAGALREGSFYFQPFLPLFLSFDCRPAPLNTPVNASEHASRRTPVVPYIVASNVGHDWREAGDESADDEDSASESWFGSSAVCSDSAVEATRWCRLGFQVEDDSKD